MSYCIHEKYSSIYAGDIQCCDAVLRTPPPRRCQKLGLSLSWYGERPLCLAKTARFILENTDPYPKPSEEQKLISPIAQTVPTPVA